VLKVPKKHQLTNYSVLLVSSVQVLDRKHSSPKWPVICWWEFNPTHSLSHALLLFVWISVYHSWGTDNDWQEAW